MPIDYNALWEKAEKNGGSAKTTIPLEFNESEPNTIDADFTVHKALTPVSLSQTNLNKINQGSSMPMSTSCYIQTNHDNHYNNNKPQTSDPLPQAPKFEVSEGKRHSIPELATEKQFSVDFIENAGGKNLRKLYFLNNRDQIEVLSCIVEHESLVRRDKSELLLKYIEGENTRIFKYSWHGTILEWKYNGQKGQGLISLTSLFYNSPLHVALLRLAKMLGIVQEYCFNTYPRAKYANNYNSHSSKYDASLIPLYLHLKDELFALKSIIEIKDLAGNVISGTCKYTSENRTIFLPATIMQNGELAGCMCIGHTSPVAYLLNRDKINRHPNAQILCPMDLQSSLALNNLVTESKVIREHEIVITGFYDSINSSLHVELDDLFGHDVILIPELNRQSMNTVLELANRCIKAGAQPVRIYPYPLLTFSANLNSEIIDSISDPWERALLQEAVVLDAVEIPSSLIKKIQRLSMPIDDYIAWGKKNGLFKGDELEEDNCYGHDLPMDLVIIESA